ncbi:TatD family hydrolase [Oceanobacillus bengalensis]|uniref:TatD family deoxyribonuclease n=1 Tax=Oceanobacillus bengalensis TaxID=1435466 RepID=A0A494Z3Q3_9BACI|nr:TatD family hydrolase [Oceanobacillus bengalensis]RKQ17158.1 TatD family deoxyribonuclease [Oceanobacillus bengalensis]
MFQSIIDAHIHLDAYKIGERQRLLKEMSENNIETMITVSQNLPSAVINLSMARNEPKVKAAFGFHPEQPLPKETEIEALKLLMNHYQEDMVAVGEIGLPYYLRKDNPEIQVEPYIEILEYFLQAADAIHKPVVLHAIYEDAPIVCSLLEKHNIKKAHFHWFKGDTKTVSRMIQNGYYISITPDVLYEEEIQQLVGVYPLSQMMVETDGPWPFEGVFKNKLTHPKMIHQSIKKIAEIKGEKLEDVYKKLYVNTRDFYDM